MPVIAYLMDFSFSFFGVPAEKKYLQMEWNVSFSFDSFKESVEKVSSSDSSVGAPQKRSNKKYPHGFICFFF